MLLALFSLGSIGCGSGSGTRGRATPHHANLGTSDPVPEAVQRVANLRPLRGIAYKPSPSDYLGNGQGLYYDSDFANDDFRQLWGPTGRDDIGNLAAAGVNFLHLYDWNQPGSGRNHANFLNYCGQKGISVAVPVSVYFVMEVANGDPNTPGWFDNMVTEVYPGGTRHPAVVMWSLGNEFDEGGEGQTADAIAQAAAAIIAAEDRAGIPQDQRVALTSPVTFGIRGGTGVEGADAVLELKQAFANRGLSDVFTTRFIASVNSFNPGSDLGPWASTRFPQATGNIPVCLFEMGKEIGGDVQTEDQQGNFYAGQLSATLPVAQGTGAFLGQCVFSTVNEAWKGGTEATFGVYKIGTPGGLGTGTTMNGQPYPLDALTQKPNFSSMQSAYTNP
jgi:hypothetical protein